MQISERGLTLIKKYEGYRAKAYKPVPTEKYWTIGYGHYGADVTEGMVITEAQGAAYLKQDCQIAEMAVNAQPYTWTQNEFDALVSFTYNCGTGNLKKLTNGGKRSKAEIAEKLMSYNKAGGKVLAGLTKRRTEEKALFLEGSKSSVVEVKSTASAGSQNGVKAKVVLADPKSKLNVRTSPSTTAAIVEKVSNGTILYSQGMMGDWYQVTDPVNGLKGFVYMRYLQLEK